MEPSATRSGSESVPALSEALEFARVAHRGQTRRQDGRPFIEHPVAVVDLLAGQRVSDDLLAAGYLHDTVEKTDVNIAELRNRFGAPVATIVAALSEDKSIEDYDQRKRALRDSALAAGRDAATVYAADRLANIQDWRRLSPSGRDAAAERLGTAYPARLTLWREDLVELTAIDPELPFLAEIEVELRTLTSTSSR